jgi:hypothetical protein
MGWAGTPNFFMVRSEGGEDTSISMPSDLRRELEVLYRGQRYFSIPNSILQPRYQRFARKPARGRGRNRRNETHVIGIRFYSAPRATISAALFRATSEEAASHIL